MRSSGSEGVTGSGSPTGERPKAVGVWLLGGFRVSVGSRPIDEDTSRVRKAANLVKLLTLTPGHRLHREEVMQLLWPEMGAKAAANNLRQVVHAARRVFQLGPGHARNYLSLRSERIVLCPERQLWVDVEAFEEVAATARRE